MTIEEGRLAERTSLLMRFFWIDKIYEIGKELGLPYFTTFSNYWDMNHYQGTLEIAKSITDQQLLELTARNKPKYALDLGGFHGKYYTATESGDLLLSGSWDVVEKNLERAVEKWGAKSYGILRALLNKGGRASYFDMIDEIESVLGYEFAPSYLLQRLTPLGLVFKTGSRRYPEWSIPSEMVPVMEKTLPKYADVSKTTPPRPTRPLFARVDPTLERLVFEIVSKRRSLNLIFSSRFKTNSEFLIQNEQAILDMMKPCKSEDDFNNRIQTLTTLIDEMDFPRRGRSIEALEAFLQSRGLAYDRKITENLRTVFNLRSKKYPIHKDDPAFVEALKHYGFSSFPPDWSVLWRRTLEEYLQTLRELKKAVEGL